MEGRHQRMQQASPQRHEAMQGVSLQQTQARKGQPACLNIKWNLNVSQLFKMYLLTIDCRFLF